MIKISLKSEIPFVNALTLKLKFLLFILKLLCLTFGSILKSKTLEEFDGTGALYAGVTEKSACKETNRLTRYTAGLYKNFGSFATNFLLFRERRKVVWKRKHKTTQPNQNGFVRRNVTVRNKFSKHRKRSQMLPYHLKSENCIAIDIQQVFFAEQKLGVNKRKMSSKQPKAK